MNAQINPHNSVAFDKDDPDPDHQGAGAKEVFATAKACLSPTA